jgi:hypothetical protein
MEKIRCRENENCSATAGKNLAPLTSVGSATAIKQNTLPKGQNVIDCENEKGKLNKVGFPKEKKEMVDYACEISSGNKSFIYKLNAENGIWDFKRRSTVWLRKAKDGKHNEICGKDLTGCWHEDSWGYCQIHRPDHPEIVNDPRMFTDWKWQMDTCYRLFSGGTKMYAVSDSAWFTTFIYE